MNTDFDVAIVGGGAAGIGAARALAASGRSTVLLEASPRLGGRAWTIEIGGHRLDLGCGWLHSADRNSWTHIAEASGKAIDRRPPLWGGQHHNLGFSPSEQNAARAAFAAWLQRLSDTPPPSDCAADALQPGGEWNGYIQAITSFISGAPLESLSVADYLAYDEAATDLELAPAAGVRQLDRCKLSISSRPATLHPGRGNRARVARSRNQDAGGAVHARAAILTVSTNVLADGAIKLPNDLEPGAKRQGHCPLVTTRSSSWKSSGRVRLRRRPRCSEIRGAARPPITFGRSAGR